MLQVAAYTGGFNIPSARFRLRQYIPYLLQHGISVKEAFPKLTVYPPRCYWLRPLWAIGVVAERLPSIALSWKCDVTFLQREMLSAHVTLEPITKTPRLLDVDDAIWLNRRDAFACRLAKQCDAVICGNAFLAEWFSRFNRNIFILPTPIDTDHFTPPLSENRDARFVIGWCGTSGGFRYLYSIEEALAEFLKSTPKAVLRIVSDTMPKFRLISAERVDYIPWSSAIELNAIQDMTVGIMPLQDTQWEQGKCSFKMLMYMACGLPVIVSPVGMNKEVLALGRVGFGACSKRDWIEALNALLHDENARVELGRNGRQLVIERFSTKTLASNLADCFRKVGAAS